MHLTQTRALALLLLLMTASPAAAQAPPAPANESPPWLGFARMLPDNRVQIRCVVNEQVPETVQEQYVVTKYTEETFVVTKKVNGNDVEETVTKRVPVQMTATRNRTVMRQNLQQITQRLPLDRLQARNGGGQVVSQARLQEWLQEEQFVLFSNSPAPVPSYYLTPFPLESIALSLDPAAPSPEAPTEDAFQAEPYTGSPPPLLLLARSTGNTIHLRRYEQRLHQQTLERTVLNADGPITIPIPITRVRRRNEISELPSKAAQFLDREGNPFDTENAHNAISREIIVPVFSDSQPIDISWTGFMRPAAITMVVPSSALPSAFKAAPQPPPVMAPPAPPAAPAPVPASDPVEAPATP